jgi:hypothetical protein
VRPQALGNTGCWGLGKLGFFVRKWAWLFFGAVSCCTCEKCLKLTSENDRSYGFSSVFLLDLGCQDRSRKPQSLKREKNVWPGMFFPLPKGCWPTATVIPRSSYHEFWSLLESNYVHLPSGNLT